MLQAKVFKERFSKVFPITDLRAFSADELVILFGNSDENWSMESELTAPDYDLTFYILTVMIALSEAYKADCGFNVESQAI